jgi:hypothetical protein
VILSVQQVELELPAGWYEMPPTNVLESSDWLFEWVESSGIPQHSRADYALALAHAGELVHAAFEADRQWIAITSRGTLVALASMVARRPELISSVPDFRVPDVRLWDRDLTYAQTVCGARISVHEFAVADMGAGPTVGERYVGTVYPTSADLAVQLEIVTDNLAAFDDMVAAGDMALAGIRLVPEL